MDGKPMPGEGGQHLALQSHVRCASVLVEFHGP